MPLQTLVQLFGKPMKLNALIVKNLGHSVASETAITKLYEHCYPRVPPLFPTPNLLRIKDMEQVPQETSLRAADSQNTPLAAGGLLSAFGRPNSTLRTEITWLLPVHTHSLRDSKIHTLATAPQHSAPRRLHSSPAILDRLVQPLGLGSKLRARPKSHHQRDRPAGLRPP